MKEAPEIDPEIRGLLEEIVRDPRSSIRLAPRRALRDWFVTGETARASDISHTIAERHLIEAHREDLAQLLVEASCISYWKQPGFCFRPVDGNGRLYSPAEGEPRWLERAESELRISPTPSTQVELLKQCLFGILPGQAPSLAQSSLALVPSDEARFFLALSIPQESPRPAIHLLERFATKARSRKVRLMALLLLGARYCDLGLYVQARDSYREASQLDNSCCALVCAFNASCLVGSIAEAGGDAKAVEQQVDTHDAQLSDVMFQLGRWIRSHRSRFSNPTQAVASRLSGGVSPVVAAVCQEYLS